MPAVFCCDKKQRLENQNIHPKMDLKLIIDINDVGFLENFDLNALPLSIFSYRHLFLFLAVFNWIIPNHFEVGRWEWHGGRLCETPFKVY